MTTNRSGVSRSRSARASWALFTAVMLTAGLGVRPAAATTSLAVTPLPTGFSASGFTDVACVGASDCWGVGSGFTSEARPLVARGNGTVWTASDVATLAGSGIVTLSSVACAGANLCWIGGRTRMANTDQGLLLRWNGSSWASVVVPTPTGATGTAVTDVSCASTSLCWAVGTADFGDPANREVRRLVLRGNGSTWSLATTPLPVGTTTSALNGVACASTSVCWAVGDATVSGARRALLLRWNGTAWSASTAPLANTATAGSLAGIDCATTTDCLAVGTNTVIGATQRLVVRWNGTAWSVVGTPLPSATTGSRLASVTCASAGACFAAGAADGASGARGLLLRWDGAAWSLSPAPSMPGTTTSTFTGTTCTSATNCVTVGTAQVWGGPRLVSLRWNGAAWSIGGLASTATTESRLDAVTCAGIALCWSVGRATVSGARRALIVGWTGSAWGIVDDGIPAASGLSGVACTGPTNCWAVGSRTVSAADQRLVMNWNGTRWSVASTPLPADTTASGLDAVACASTSSCLAVGSGRIAGVRQPLVLRWNGTAWSVVTASVPLPVGTTAAEFHGVTCTSTSDCWVVGDVTVSGTKQRLITRWNGAAWTTVATPLPSGTTASALEGVGCSGANLCWAVGTATVADATQRLLLRWNGSAWSVATTPLPVGATSSRLDAVTCAGTSDCLAVGSSISNAMQRLMLRWNGSAWAIVTTPLPSGATGSDLTGVGCASGAGCWSVGRFKPDSTTGWRRLVIRFTP